MTGTGHHRHLIVPLLLNCKKSRRPIRHIAFGLRDDLWDAGIGPLIPA